MFDYILLLKLNDYTNFSGSCLNSLISYYYLLTKAINFYYDTPQVLVSAKPNS